MKHPGDDRKCGHEYIVAAVCDDCKRYIEKRREIRRSKRRRIPPAHICAVGHQWRGYSDTCPECAKALDDDNSESWRETRRRIHGDQSEN